MVEPKYVESYDGVDAPLKTDSKCDQSSACKMNIPKLALYHITQLSMDPWNIVQFVMLKYNKKNVIN